MARRARQQANKVQPTAETLDASATRPQPPQNTSTKVRSLLLSAQTSRALGLVILAALYSPLSQLILSPVFGSIPSAAYHRYGLLGSSLLAFGLKSVLPRWIERGLPAFAFWIPSIQLVLFNFSSRLGNPVGPLVIEWLTCFPLIVWSLHMASKLFDDVDLSFLGSDAMEEAAPSMVCYMLFIFIQRVFKDALPHLTNFGYLSSRVGLQLAVGTLYGLLLPGSLFWPALPSVVITMTGNIHNQLSRTTDVLNNTLALHDYVLLERRESVTGYISVFEDRKKGFRAMRCDHSLLGGQWLDQPSAKVGRKIAEPIYAVFTTMEAVRLVEPPKGQKVEPNRQRTALNIGLGVGTAPSALIAHGVNVTIVELDPVVLYFASKYFGLPSEHRYVIADAAVYVEYQASQAVVEEQYDYILHDVFTGGAVPTSLFTFDFLLSLTKLLKPDGTIVINYAGDLNMPSASMVYRTISTVFPNCRIFRDEPESTPKKQQDFTNLVYFCTHPSNQQPIQFRRPVKADYLGSGARQQSLVPKHELDVASKFRSNVEIISRKRGVQKELQSWQLQDAIGHWRLMRTVIPDIVWENW